MRALLGSLVMISVATGSAHAFELKKDATGATVRWAGPLHLTVSAAFDERLDATGALDALRASASSYAGHDGVPTVDVVLGQTTGVGYDLTGKDNHNEVVVLEDWPFNPTALASTVVTLDRSSHTIIDADVAFNAQLNDFKVLGATSVRGGHFDDVQNTFTHELGHALGLAHEQSDALAVMYPEAFSGDINKRQLAADDEAGLTALYGGAVTGSDPTVDPGTASPGAVGCSSTGTAAWPLSVLLGLVALARTRRLAVRRAVPVSVARPRRPVHRALPMVALMLAASSASAADAVLPVQLEATATVTAARTLLPPGGRGLWMTELTVSVGRCVRGACTPTMTVLVPGGRSGELEQVIEGQSVPEVGAEVHLTQYLVKGRARSVVEPSAAVAPSAAGPSAAVPYFK